MTLSRLYSLRARYYAPGLGRFLSRDPFEGTLYGGRELNRYVYAANNPVNLADPSGRYILLQDAQTRKQSQETAIGAAIPFQTPPLDTIATNVPPELIMEAYTWIY